MTSLGKNKGPYSLDVNMVKHRNVTTTTILNTPKFDSILADLGSAYNYEVGYIPAGYEHRPDLISNVFYGTPKNWLLLMLVNGISDPGEGFRVNQKIIIPKF